METKELIQQAILARKMAYAPYSGYMVGAALLCTNGRVFLGCNIESASYTPTNCAERTAFFKAVSEGERDFCAIAVIGAHKDAKPKEYGYFYPCGVCRQVMMEFCNPDTFRVITARNAEEYCEYSLRELMPFGFGPNNLKFSV